MEIKFCRRCGTPLTPKQDGEFVCQNKHRVFYKASTAVVLSLINGQGDILLGVRGFEPDKGSWDLPGGFCNYEEDLMSAVHREITEELGLHATDYTEPQYLHSGIDYYLWEGELEPVLNVHFWARLQGNPTITASDDLAQVMWVPLATVDLGKFAPTFKSVTQSIPLLQQRLG